VDLVRIPRSSAGHGSSNIGTRHGVWRTDIGIMIDRVTPDHVCDPHHDRRGSRVNFLASLRVIALRNPIRTRLTKEARS